MVQKGKPKALLGKKYAEAEMFLGRRESVYHFILKASCTDGPGGKRDFLQPVLITLSNKSPEISAPWSQGEDQCSAASSN